MAGDAKSRIQREIGKDGGFVYRMNGRRIRQRSELQRIDGLAIPPAWTDVEISRSPTAKVLARGHDAEGRVQRIYHPAFRRKRDRRKFDRLVRFAEALPGLRAHLDKDLHRHQLDRDVVAACALRLIDDLLLRVGNPYSAKVRKSFGVTTLREEHVELTKRGVRLDFVAKSGQRQRRSLRDPSVARVVARLAADHAQQLFHFAEECQEYPLHGDHLNAYLRRHLGAEFTTKDFRTWGATVAAAAEVLECRPSELTSAKTVGRARREATVAASKRLGNTPAVAKSSYIHPRVLEAVDRPDVLRLVRRRRSRMRSRRHFGVDEQATLVLLAAMARPHPQPG